MTIGGSGPKIQTRREKEFAAAQYAATQNLMDFILKTTDEKITIENQDVEQVARRIHEKNKHVRGVRTSYVPTREEFKISKLDLGEGIFLYYAKEFSLQPLKNDFYGDKIHPKHAAVLSRVNTDFDKDSVIEKIVIEESKDNSSLSNFGVSSCRVHIASFINILGSSIIFKGNTDANFAFDTVCDRGSFYTIIKESNGEATPFSYSQFTLVGQDLNRFPADMDYWDILASLVDERSKPLVKAYKDIAN